VFFSTEFDFYSTQKLPVPPIASIISFIYKGFDMVQIDSFGSASKLIHKIRRCVAGAVVCAGLLATGSANADNLRIVTGEFPPLTNNSTADKGLLFDMVTEMAKLVNASAKVEFMLWNDAQKLAQTEKNVLIFPMTRTPQREASFTWVAKIFNMDRPFTSLPGTKPINSMEEARSAGAVGVLERSASLNFLKEGGITKIIEYPSNRAMMEGLKSGQIATLYSPKPYSVFDWQSLGGAGSLVFGKAIETAPAYIAAGPEFDKASLGKWVEAFDLLQQDQTFDKLMVKYGLN
jgi:polar amino acid transport system substrate-binding protein